MSKEEINNFVYEDEYLSYKSYLKDFTKEKFQEFDEKAKKIGLESRIKDLMDSKIVNDTENQAALHPEYRQMYKYDEDDVIPDNFMSSSKNYDFESANDFYMDISEMIEKEPDAQINVISIGIGGSLEGPKLMLESNIYTNRYHQRNKQLNFDFLTGPDTNEFKMKVSHLDPHKTFFIIFSKSFETIETLEMLNIAIKWSGDTNKFLALTSNKEEAQKHGISYVNTFDKEIGGRYSIWLEDIESIFGGRWTYNGRMLNAGGAVADSKLLSDKEYLDLVKYLSFSDIWMNNFNGKHTRVILSYIWNLRSLPDYIQQLEMESLGKPHNTSSEFKKTGQIIFGGYGPKAEHSYLQLLHQGTQDMCADIIACNNDTNDLEYIKAITQAKLLSEGADGLTHNEKINGNVPVNLFLIKKNKLFKKGVQDSISEETLGYLIATWEHRTFITATMLGINPFDQFGVNAGKIYTKKYLNNKD